MTKRTDGSGLDHVADGETLDCLILGGASRAVAAADGLDVAAALLVATAKGERSQQDKSRERSHSNCLPPLLQTFMIQPSTIHTFKEVCEK